MTAQEEFAELARTLKSVMTTGQGFALLMKLADDQYHYASNADRADVRKTFVEWIAHAEARVNTRDSGETLAKAKTEAKCVALGHLLEKEGHRVVFFLFDFGDRGNLAWYTNTQNALGVVKQFLEVTNAER
jgi:hypothetical protein